MKLIGSCCGLIAVALTARAAGVTAVASPGAQAQERHIAVDTTLTERELKHSKPARVKAAAAATDDAAGDAAVGDAAVGDGATTDGIDEEQTGSEAPGRHKDLFPLDATDYVGFVLTALGLMLAAGGGIGGGGILVSIFVLIMHFAPKTAVPLSNVTIFAGAIANTAIYSTKRHPKADRPLVDWNLILIMEPPAIGGALVGSFLNKMIPEQVMVVLLVLLLAFTAYRTLEKGIKVYKRESAALASARRKSARAGNGYQAVSNEAPQAVADGAGLVEKGGAVTYGSTGNATRDVQLEEILEEERRTPLAKVALLSTFFIITLCLNLLRGGGGFQSPLGLTCGTPPFWGLVTLILAWVVGVCMIARSHLIGLWRLKQQCGYPFKDGDVQWTPRTATIFPALCFFAGLMAGLFGIGGGMIKGPLMLEMGVLPQVASATSACMILYTSFTATTSFVVFGLMKEDYALMLMPLGLIATAIGQVTVSHLAKRYQRSSIIILIIGGTVALSTVLLASVSVHSIKTGMAHGAGGLCSHQAL